MSEQLLSSIIPFAGSGLDTWHQDQHHNDNRMFANMLKKLLYTVVAVIIGMTYFVVAYH